jgi:hypothetical protein
MNYVKQMNAFEDYSDRTGLPASTQLIYYKLFAMNNRVGWVEWFESTNPYLMFKAGIKDEGTFIRHRNTLKQCGLIDFISGKKGQPTRYNLIKLYTEEINTGINQVNMPVNMQVNVPVKTPPIMPVETPDIYKYKLNVNENKNINNSACAGTAVDNFSDGQPCRCGGAAGFYTEEYYMGEQLLSREVTCSCVLEKQSQKAVPKPKELPSWADRVRVPL